MSVPASLSLCRQQLAPADLEWFDALVELALDMRWSWNHATDQVWRQLDPVLWDLTHNPWVVLQTVSREKLQRELAEPGFQRSLGELGPDEAGQS
jgi:starch phosphorylase